MTYPTLDIADQLPRHKTKRPYHIDEEGLVNVMVHHSGSENDVFADARWHVNGKGWWGMAYYKSIDYDGTVYVCRKRTEQGWHCRGGGMNWTGLPICLRGNMNEHPPTADQIDSVIAEIIKENTDLGRRLNIVWHKDYSPTDCPGEFMPIADIAERVNAYYQQEQEPEPEPEQPPKGCIGAALLLLLIAAIADYLF